MTPSFPSTNLASFERSSREEIEQAGCKLRAAPLVKALLDSVPDLVMVLNQRREIVLANARVADFVGAPVESLLGFRPGEVLRCDHVRAGPSGCGTSRFCERCGASRALANCQTRGVPDEQECRILRQPGSDPLALDLRVWARPFEVDGQIYTVFAVRDISDEKRRQALERLFFHDVMNTASGLCGLLEAWPDLEGEEARETEDLARHLAEHLVEDIQTQRDLAAAERGDLAVRWERVNVRELLEELCGLYRHHPIAQGKQVPPPRISGVTHLWTSAVLLRRILGNLIKNALEASRVGQTITIGFARADEAIFTIHNETVMPEEVQLQMFQRSFSTKGCGRGLGSYSVKLLTERYLGGTVVFVSAPGVGTTFTLRLPMTGPKGPEVSPGA